MKKLFSLLALLLFVTALFSQQQAYRTTTITVLGNRIRQVIVDDKAYPVTTSASGEKTIVISDLSNGSHTLEIVRNNQNIYQATPLTNFTLRQGYDMNITISANGSVNLSESRTGTGGSRQAISATVFNRLYNQVRNQRSSISRSNLLESEFSSTNRFYTSQQARRLIALVNSESLRLKLAKQVYLKVTDKNNFHLVSSLLNSSSNRTELNNYISSLPVDELDEDEMLPLTDEEFRAIYEEVTAESSFNDRNYYLSNFFGKTYNYYTSEQARQLIQLIPSESERFSLAKKAYRGVTDEENYYREIAPLLSSSVNRSELQNYINSFDNANPKTAMSSTAFNNLYQSVYYQSTASARYQSINTAFTTSGNYFTSTQAKQLIQLVNDENSRLALAKTAYRVLVDRSNYTILNDLFNYQSSRDDLANYVRYYGNSYNSGVPMSDADFNMLYRNINNAWSSANRFNLASEAFQNNNNRFSSLQVRQLLLLINSETDRLSLAKAAYDNVVDPASFSQVYDVFSTTERKNELARFVSDVQNGGTGTSYKIPMAESEFTSLYREVQLTFGFGAKMSSLRDIFNKETNYFTVQQVKQLIQLVSSESNRVELAKLAYNNLTDPANFTQLYDIFSLQSSKDELNTYINQYR